MIADSVLLFFGVANTDRQTQRVSQVKGALSKQSPGVRFLIEIVVTTDLIGRVHTVARDPIQRTVRRECGDQVLRHQRCRFRRQAIYECKKRGEQAIKVGVDHHLALHIELVLVDVTAHGVGEAIADVSRPANFLTELLKIVDVRAVDELQWQPVHVDIIEVLIASEARHRRQRAAT